MRTLAEAIGWIVMIMFVLGALDIADFRLIFKAKQARISIHDKKITNIECPSEFDDENNPTPAR